MAASRPRTSAPSLSDARRTESARAEPARAEPARTELGRNEPGRNEPGRSASNRTGSDRGESNRAGSTRGDANRSEPRRSDPRQAEPRQAEPRQAQGRQAETRQAETRQGEARQGEARRTQPARRTQAAQGPRSQSVRTEPVTRLLATQSPVGPQSVVRQPVSAVPTQTRSFTELGLPLKLVAAMAQVGITEPFPIQNATLPDSLAGRDVLGRGRTGSGKTYAFLLPVLARLAQSTASSRPGRPRALILAPTRELATQIHAAMAPLAAALSLRTMTIFGGVGASPQIRGLQAGVDVLVACPGRLEDHVREGHARLDAIEITVLDEADHMADLGFLPAVRRLLERTPEDGQRLLFSATLDGAVDVLVRRFMSNPATHQVDSASSPVTTMSHHVLHVREEERLPVLVDLAAAPGRTLVFTRTKHGAKKLTRQLNAAGVRTVELHGNLAQNARDRNLRAFTDGTANTLVATDIAARGIHVDEVTLVVHADPPVEHKAYLHRSGRTARAGADGTVITLMTDEQVTDVRQLTRMAGISPTTTRLRPGDPLLHRLAPGERTFSVIPLEEPADRPSASPRGGGQAGRGRSRRGTGAVATASGTGGRTGARTATTRATVARAAASRSGASATTVATTVAAPKHGGAAAFSAGTRVGGRRGR